LTQRRRSDFAELTRGNVQSFSVGHSRRRRGKRGHDAFGHPHRNQDHPEFEHELCGQNNDGRLNEL
jgi:hypothetical protein